MKEKEWESICKTEIKEWNELFHAKLEIVTRKDGDRMRYTLHNGDDYICTCLNWYDMYHRIAAIRAGMQIMISHFTFMGAD